MIDINSLYIDFKNLVNTFQGGFYPPSVFSTAVSNISLEMWNKYTEEAERSQQAKDYLLPFLKSKNVMATKANSYYSMIFPPSDYGRFAGSKIITNRKNVFPDQSIDDGKVFGCDNFKDAFPDLALEAKEYQENTIEVGVENVDSQRWEACLSHVFKYPTVISPKMTQANGGWKIAPASIGVVVLYYFVMPSKVNLVYDTTDEDLENGEGGEFVYNKIKSVSLEWYENARPEFLWRLGERFGVYTRDQFMTSLSNNNKNNP